MSELNKITDVKDVTVHLYVCGYETMGESILCFLFDEKEEKVLYSYLIDSYYLGKNRLYPILDFYGINQRKLDSLIWTHPDLDHSKGIVDIVDLYCNENTLCHYPECLISYKVHCKKKMSSQAQAVYAKLKQQKGKDPVAICGVNSTVTLDERVFLDDFGNELSFSLSALTPRSNFLADKTDDKEILFANDFSIATLMNVGNLNFLFGADTTNAAWDTVPDGLLNNLDFIKVPHHGSDSSYGVISLSSPRQSLAYGGCTVFRKHDLPKDFVLDGYKKICDAMFLTNGGKTGEKFGVVEYVYKVSSMAVYKPNLYGDASQFY